VDIDSGQQSPTVDIVQTSIWALAGSHRITLDETDNACIQLPWSNARSSGERVPGYVRYVQPDPLRHHPRSSWRYGSWRGEWDIDGEVDASRASPVGDRKGPIDSHTRELLTRKAAGRVVASFNLIPTRMEAVWTRGHAGITTRCRAARCMVVFDGEIRGSAGRQVLLHRRSAEGGK